MSMKRRIRELPVGSLIQIDFDAQSVNGTQQ